VRNALLGRKVDDIDIATPLTPDKVMKLLEAAGIKTVPTGIAHGTLTAVVDGKPFEITTLRRDVKTDGRHAEVVFGADWAEDAWRRDFTMNALYAATDGEVFDYAGGVEDLQAGRVRFVGNAATRIVEDYLRILRLFRFHAWYGKGEIEAGALRAAAEGREGIRALSGERIAKEMLKLLAAKNPAPALRKMESSGILAEILPGAPAIAPAERLAEIDRQYGFIPDGLLRLAALEPDMPAVGEHWKLSNAQRKRLEDIAGAREEILPSLNHREARRLLHRKGVPLFNDLLLLNWARDSGFAHDDAWCALLELADFFAPPRFPLTGRDVIALGVPQGPKVGKVLCEVEEWWVEHDFTADKFSLAERLTAAARAAAKT
jgi:poly(A) polymerase